MFRKTRIKIMVFITTTIMLLLFGTVVAISLSSYIEQVNQTAAPAQGDAQAIEIQMSVIRMFVKAMIRNTFRVGAVIVLIVFISSYFISGWIIRPLEESHKKQKQFISDAGHELKTPVAAIEANAELLQGDIGENKWLENIRYESGRMTALIRQMLDLARAESVNPVREEMDLSRVIMGSILPYEGIAFEKGFELQTDIDSDISFTGDKGQMQQLAEILLNNAIDHAEGKGIIEISLKRDGSNIVFTVTNPGKEISQEDRENLFERFYRADKAHSSDGHYGLGLAIAKTIVVSHKGNISVESRDGKNSFIVRI